MIQFLLGKLSKFLTSQYGLKVTWLTESSVARLNLIQTEAEHLLSLWVLIQCPPQSSHIQTSIINLNQHGEPKMTEEQIVQHVQDNARYYAQLDQPYSVGWGGKSLFANSPRDLVNQILKIEKQ